MSLKSRLDEVLDAADWLTLTNSARPELQTVDVKPVVFTRYAGFQILGPRKRHRVDVMMVMGVAESTTIADGQGFEDSTDRLIEEICKADDAYPELLPATVNYNMEVFGTKRRYISVVLMVLGE